MADPTNLGSEIRELKIGSTFYDNETAFDALRYDFKPASVVSGSQEATLEIGPNHQVTVTHVSSLGAPPTVFKGSRRPYRKECVLIIDKITGVVTLERLSSNIQLKKTRLQGNKQLNNSNSSVVKPPIVGSENLSPSKKNGIEGNVARSIQKETSSPQDNSKTNLNRTPPKIANIVSSPISSLPTSEDSNSNRSNTSIDRGNTACNNSRDSPDSTSFQCDASEGEDESSHVSDSESDSDSSGTNSEPATPYVNISGHCTYNDSSNISTVTMSNPFLNRDLQLSESGSDTE